MYVISLPEADLLHRLLGDLCRRAPAELEMPRGAPAMLAEIRKRLGRKKGGVRREQYIPGVPRAVYFRATPEEARLIRDMLGAYERLVPEEQAALRALAARFQQSGASG